MRGCAAPNFRLSGNSNFYENGDNCIDNMGNCSVVKFN